MPAKQALLQFAPVKNSGLWLKDKALEESEDMPEPDMLAQAKSVKVEAAQGRKTLASRNDYGKMKAARRFETP